MTGIRRGVRFACGSHCGSYCGAGMRCGTIAHPLCATQLRANHSQLFIYLHQFDKKTIGISKTDLSDRMSVQ
ncbi:hypothetical protein P3T42_005211 [Paraburkholderia sp. GAS38]|uniref:hypothetical protein n=1 Tax=Paraburkholderia sp. GAS38 TaxID=3035133 RepID=UPI003D25FA15